MPIDAKQQAIVDAVIAGRSVFFTGCAGTGKTFVMNEIVEALRKKYHAEFEHAVAITAMTGIAATHIEGTTLNYALGIKVPMRYIDFMMSMSKKDVAARTRRMSVLIIDECSMMSAEFFEVMDAMLRKVRRNPGKPAGGLQLIICGDFYQLPPVYKKAEGHVPPDAFTNFGYAFQSAAWKQCFRPCDHVVLTHVYRQRDEDYVETLDRIRTGRDAFAALKSLVAECSRPIQCAEGVRPTELFARNVDVDRINNDELAALDSPLRVFTAIDRVTSINGDVTDVSKAASFFRDCTAAPFLSIKVGAQVMILKNMDPSSGIVNGSRGVVIGYTNKRVALEAMRASLSASQLTEASSLCAMMHEDVVPRVRLVSGVEIDVLPALFRQEINSIGECKRVQIPLKLAWTITVHKSQGLTLDAVRVSLSGMFAPGQAYVALSRVRSKAGLQIIDWDGRVVKPDADVSAFYAWLDGKGAAKLNDDAWSAFCNMRWGSATFEGMNVLQGNRHTGGGGGGGNSNIKAIPNAASQAVACPGRA